MRIEPIGYRRKHLESLVRRGEEEAGKIAEEYRQASAQQEQEYAETAAALAQLNRDRHAPVRCVRFIAERCHAAALAPGSPAPHHELRLLAVATATLRAALGQAMSLRSIPRAKTALPSAQLGDESGRI